MGTSASFTLCNSVSSVNIKKCNAKINPESSHKHPLSQIFGAPLETLREAGLMVCGVPLVLHNMVEYLDHYGVQQKGLFRVSGSVTKVNLLKTKYDAGEAVDLQMEGDAQCVASLMKLFLRELPTSLIPAVLHTDLITAFRESKDEAELNHLLKKQLDSLPADHYSLLSYLTHFLLRVAAHSQDNQMTAENLATVFGPCIFQVPVGPNMLRDQFVCNAIVRHLLKNREVLLRAGWEATPPALQPAHAATEWQASHSERSEVTKNTIPREKSTEFLGSPEINLPANPEELQKLVPVGTEQGSSPHREVAVPGDTLTSITGLSTSLILSIQGISNSGVDSKQSLENTGELHEESLERSNQQRRRQAVENNELGQGLSAALLSARERRRLLRGQEGSSRGRITADHNKENLPCDAVFSEEGEQLPKDTMPHTEKKPLGDLEKHHEDDFQPKRSKSSTGLILDQEQDYSKNMDNVMPNLSTYQKETGAGNNEVHNGLGYKEAQDFQNSKVHILKEGENGLQESKELNELMKGGLMGGIQLQPAAQASFFPASEGKGACSQSTDQGEDSAQIQGNKEQSLPTARSVQAEESSNPGEPVPALRILHHERESSAESQQAPGPSRLLHYITDGDSPLPSPRCPSFSQSQRFNSDPESAPSPPSAQQFIMSRGIVRTVPSEGSKEPLSVALLTKHIQNLKKKIKKFEERFEQERKYRPSHNDKTANPEMFKLMDDLAKSRKQLKDLKLKQSVVELRERRTDSQTEMSRVSSDPQGGAEQQHKPCLEETVDTLLKRLKEKRSTLGLPENMKEMNQNQMALEKVTLQKCLLYFESLHGRPVTKQERNLMKPLYDRYRAIKQLLCSTPSITTIEEEDSDDDNMPHSPAPPSRALCQISTDESLCPQDEDNETAFVSPLDEVKAVRQPAITMSNLHEASKPELLEYLRETRAEKHRLRRALREFEDQFFKQMGRAAQKEDRIPMAEEYYEYKNIKAKLRLLEVLLSKQEASKTI
nr:PREDICTED: protein FAM13C [Lepisosteus oculatus]